MGGNCRGYGGRDADRRLRLHVAAVVAPGPLWVLAADDAGVRLPAERLEGRFGLLGAHAGESAKEGRVPDRPRVVDDDPPEVLQLLRCVLHTIPSRG